MDESTARTLIAETFTRAFDKDRYARFVRELVNRYDESKAFRMNHHYVADAFKQHVRQYERLGTYTTPGENEKLDILIVYLAADSKLERARTAQRDFVAHYLKGRDEKDAALVAFVPPDKGSWRFSYVRMDYVVGKAELTPARRLSYLVGEGESCHTAQSRFVGLLKATATDPTLAQIEEAFSVEAITREFFRRYRELFEELNESLEGLIANDRTVKTGFADKGIATVDFSKKLLGQIVFLYFLQKKGWLGVAKGGRWGDGPRDFLRRLANAEFGEYTNFFNDILEPLFYDTLATDRGDDAWCSRFRCRIPFLNGGLFEPIGDYDWRRTEILLPNEIFTNTRRNDQGDRGTGILDVFDRYNFTVNEAEPLEKDVAIDPEMLGKVFENLIEENRRKGLGAFYTPREIVHYMCRESLINYLDYAINRPEVPFRPEKPRPKNQPPLFVDSDHDRAVSRKPGEYTVIRRRDIVPRADLAAWINQSDQFAHYAAAMAAGTKGDHYPKPPKSIRDFAAEIDAALRDITVCDPAIGSGAFPVGMMMEIVRARAALTPWFIDLAERTTYLFKRHAIQNSIYGVDIDPGAVEIAKLRLWLSLVVDEEDIREIKPLPNLDFKIVEGNSLLGVEKNLFNQEKFNQLEALKTEFFNEADHGKKARLKHRIENLIHDLTSGRKVFDFAIYFSEVFHAKEGFDVVIGNPPYVRQEEIKDLKPLLKPNYECYTGTADLFVYFYERGIKLLRNGGQFAFITSNKWYRSGYGEKLRDWLNRNTRIHELIDFGDAPVFEAIAYPTIVLLERAMYKKEYSDFSFRAFTWSPGPPISEFVSHVRKGAFEIPQRSLDKSGWRLAGAAERNLLAKLRAAGTPLGEYCKGKFYRGILTGLNEAFVVDRATRDRLIAEHPSSEDVLKPFLRGRDVKRWQVDFAEQYLIKIESSENAKHPWSGKSEKEAEKTFAATYPAIHAFQRPLRERLIKRDDQGKYFWELRSCAYWKEFERPKIVYPNICKQNEFSWDANGYYVNQKAFIIPQASKYLLSVLNSSTVNFLFRQMLAKLQNGFYEPSSIFLELFPIPSGDSIEQAALEDLAENVLQVTTNGDIANFESEINDRVYRLFGLTREEIALIEEP